MTEKTIAILGAGNIGLSMAYGLVQSGMFKPGQITLTRRNISSLAGAGEAGYIVSTHNGNAVTKSEIILLSVLPQQLDRLMEDIKLHLTERHLVISVITGVTIANLANGLGESPALVRAMPNTAIAVGESITCLSYNARSEAYRGVVEEIFNTVGEHLEIKEELMTPATALAACAIAFFLRAIRAATQGGIEIGFHPEDALHISIQVAKGAGSLLSRPGAHPEKEIDKVTSPRGCTIAGLNEMEHHGFSSALIRGIKTSAEKAGSLYKND